MAVQEIRNPALLLSVAVGVPLNIVLLCLVKRRTPTIMSTYSKVINKHKFDIFSKWIFRF